MRYLNSKGYLRSSITRYILYKQLSRLANDKLSDISNYDSVWKRIVQLDAMKQIRLV